jgi:hypothetical protein
MDANQSSIVIIDRSACAIFTRSRKSGRTFYAWPDHDECHVDLVADRVGPILLVQALAKALGHGAYRIAAALF